MASVNLTAAAVARIKPPQQGQADHFDKGYPGLALRLSYGGAKSWVFFYRLHGKQSRLTLGRYPEMGLAKARDAWRQARELVAKGESPAHQRPASADGFENVFAEWLQRDQSKNRRVWEVERAMRRDVVPALGPRPISGISRRDIIEILDAVADRGSVTMARRLHAHLNRLFVWAIGRGIVQTNPMAGLPRHGETVKRDRVLTDVELAAVWREATNIGWPFGDALRLLILTACRREEIAGLKWSEIHGDVIELAGNRTKNGEAHTIPLSSSTREIIAELPHVADCDYVFSITGRTPISGWSAIKRGIDAKLNIPAWRIHDLRRTAASGLQKLGVQVQVTEAILNHVGSRSGIIGVYQRHDYAAEKRQALNAWARHVAVIVSGKPAKVISLRP